MSPTPRAAALAGLLAVSALLLPLALVTTGVIVLGVSVVVEAFAVRRRPEIERTLPRLLVRGSPGELRASARPQLGTVRLRQPSTPDIGVEPAEGEGSIDARILPRRRGRHELPPVGARREGPLGLGRWSAKSHADDTTEVLVYPDIVRARRLAHAVRRGTFRAGGQHRRGPLGLGTDFESVRDYVPDDDIRQVNWQATARLGHPMSNQYRIEQDREVLLVIDAGRLMGAPLESGTRLDAALDTAVAIAAVAEELGDRCGVIAFDAAIRRHVRPRRAAADGITRALFDLEPAPVDSDYELAFRTALGGKRAFVLVLTDIVDESAARPLVEAVPLFARRHALAVASAVDPDLASLILTSPAMVGDAYAMSVAVDVRTARDHAITLLRHSGAQVIQAPGPQLPAVCVSAYLRAKSRGRL